MSRPFTPHERAVFQRIVEKAPDAEILRSQIDASEYGEPWFEGSWSFSIVPIGEAPVYPHGESIGGGREIGPVVGVHEAGAASHRDENVTGSMFLSLYDGRIGDLEYWWVTEEMPDGLPGLDQLSD